SGVILAVEEHAGLDSGRRAALRGWVAMGGHLFLSPSFSGTESVEKIGAGEITTWAEPVEKIAAIPTPTVTTGTSSPGGGGGTLNIGGLPTSTSISTSTSTLT